MSTRSSIISGGKGMMQVTQLLPIRKINYLWVVSYSRKTRKKTMKERQEFEQLESAQKGLVEVMGIKSPYRKDQG
jgi:hypothetical protein